MNLADWLVVTEPKYEYREAGRWWRSEERIKHEKGTYMCFEKGILG